MLATPAWAARDAKSPLAPFPIQRREPGPHDVQIDIAWCGVCHSDLHTARGEWEGTRFPVVPGHEIAGTVARVGGSVTRFKVGEAVGVGCFVDTCRECDSCREGLGQYCEKGMIQTYNSLDEHGETPTYGGYSTRIVVDENYVLRMPAGIPLDQAAPLLCAGITTYSPLRHWEAGQGKKVAVVGLGGLGHMGVKIARAMGAEVAVLSQSRKKQADAERLGAHEFHATGEEGTFEKLADRFDIVLNTVSAPMDWNALIRTLRRDGTMVMVGASPDPVPVGTFPLIMKRRRLAGSLIGGIAETQEMLDFCGKHRIGADVERISIDKINDAYERMLKGDVRYRFVIDSSTIR